MSVGLEGRWGASRLGECRGDIWHGETGEFLTRADKAYSSPIRSLDLSPDGTMLASGSAGRTTKLWTLKPSQLELQGNTINYTNWVRCVQYSPSGEHLAITTEGDIEIYNPSTRHCVANFKGHSVFAWTPDGTQLLSAGLSLDPAIWKWDASTWKQVGDPWTSHTYPINAIAINPAGTLVASASYGKQVRLWRLSDRQTISIFQSSCSVTCVTFSMDGKDILSGADDKILQWAVPKDLSKDASKEHVSKVDSLQAAPDSKVTHNFHYKAQNHDSKILVINKIARNTYITSSLSIAEGLTTQEINADANDYNSYANRSFIMAHKLD